MKVDFENKTIEIESGDTFEKLKGLVENHNLHDFKLEPKQYYWNGYYYPIPMITTLKEYPSWPNDPNSPIITYLSHNT